MAKEKLHVGETEEKDAQVGQSWMVGTRWRRGKVYDLACIVLAAKDGMEKDGAAVDLARSPCNKPNGRHAHHMPL